MRMYKVIIIAILSVILILTGCEKDEVVPIAEEKTTNAEQATSEAPVEQKEETTTIEEQAEQSKPVQQGTAESTSTTNDSSADSDIVVTTKEEPKEPTKESTAQKSTAESSTNQTITTEKEETVTNKTSTTTQKTQTTPEKKTTNDQSTNQTTTEKEQTATPPPKKEAPKQTVAISIVGDQQKGTILSSTKVEMIEGNTVLDITTKILKQKGIPISVTGGGSGAYVEGIANLFEFDHGPLSGWTVKRNGAKLDRSSGAVQVKSGDSIQWIYTSDYEADGK